MKRNLTRGFLVGGGLLLVGLILQLTAGPVDWSRLAAPVNAIVLAAVLVLIGVMYRLRGKVPFFEWMMHYPAAVPCICYALGLTILMGLTVQTPRGGVLWLSQMLRFWPFVLIWSWMMLIAGLAGLSHLLRWKWREIPFVLNHLGVFLAVSCATLGHADLQKMQMKVYPGTPEWQAVDERGNVCDPGLAIELHRFTMETYGSGMPRRFSSDISVYTKAGKDVDATVEVNKPLRINLWWIYQYGYDVVHGPASRYSVFLLVRDPWLPAVYLGIVLMLGGALALVVMKLSPRRKGVLPVALLLTGFFTFLTVTRMGPTAKDLPPALQSPWFIPHLIVYMAGYALLATATLLALYQLIRKRNTQMDLTDGLVNAGLAFLTFGMLFGALWAKEAWGHYWGWDPKETWAAITWLGCLLYIHFRRTKPSEWRTACGILLLAFVCLQFCWWGINYLPAAQGHSVHTYN